MGNMAFPLSWFLLITLSGTLLISCSATSEEESKADNESLLWSLVPCSFILCHFMNCVYWCMLENLWLQEYIVYMRDLLKGDISASTLHTNTLQQVFGRSSIQNYYYIYHWHQNFQEVRTKWNLEMKIICSAWSLKQYQRFSW